MRTTSSVLSAALRRLKDRTLLFLGLPQHLTSDAYIKYARERGCSIGDGTEFFGEKKLDLGVGPMIEIGENCVITDRVRMVAHTSDKTILRKRYGPDRSPSFGSVGRITIGDNVFIGENSMVLPNVTIGENCIIGSGSVVADDIPSDSVAAGNPCREIMSLEEYRDHCMEKEEEMIRTYVSQYKKRGLEPRRNGIESFIRENTEFESVSEFDSNAKQ